MSDSITTLQNQMAALLEDPGLYNNRCPDSVDIPIESTDLGPAIRERTYARTHHASRSDMQTMAERVNELESNLAFYYSELMDEAIVPCRTPRILPVRPFTGHGETSRS